MPSNSERVSYVKLIALGEGLLFDSTAAAQVGFPALPGCVRTSLKNPRELRTLYHVG
jgi:hypothetical protein